jgi:hypothetical protein
MGRPPGSLNKDKPFRDAIRMEAVALEAGEECVAPKGSLRYIARQLLLRACEDTPSSREVGDRLDGKPAQAIIGGEDDATPIQMIVTGVPRAGD